MGEVYRATDTKLGRDVALKFLPPQFASDPDRMSRFQREAQVLAQLNHPNIATIHGLEESGAVRALVMELVDGPTLADRIAQGPIPLDEALSIAKQVAEALEYAHERGIIHRDLKPANIKLTLDGKVKVLDFGLAKALSEDAANSNFSNSPTLSLAATAAGVIMGTAAYMSPEQAKGKTADRRADIWAFGVVLFEMLTGRMLFPGETAAESMALVIAKELDFNALRSSVPPRLRELLRRCLTRDPRNRLQAIGDARIVVEETIADPEPKVSATLANPVVVRPRSRRALAWTGGVLVVVLIVVLVSLWWTVQEVRSSLRLSAELGADVSLETGIQGAAAIVSPDGSLFAFTGRKTTGERPQLHIRRLDQLKASPLSGTEGAQDPFFSPDGKWIAFFADGKLKKVSVTGGAAVTLCEASDQRGGSWSDDGSIVFAPTGLSPLFRVSSAGGIPEPLTKFEKLDKDTTEVTHRWPQVLPGGHAVLFTSNPITGNYENASIVAQSLDTGERKIVQRGGYYGRYFSSGHLAYVHDTTLFVAPFDPKNLEMAGQPFPAIEGVMGASNNASSQFAFSNDGTLVYLPGNNIGVSQSIYWMNPEAKMTPLRATPGIYWNPRFSSDGRKLAIEVLDKQRDVWVYEWGRDTMSRLTLDPGTNRYPLWTPDGRRIAFASGRAGSVNLYWQRADGTGEVQRLTESKNQQTPASWHPSGKLLAFTESRPQSGDDMMILPMDGDEASGWKPGKPYVFLASSFSDRWPRFSPDGRWIAYASNDTGRSEVYVRPFPGPGGKWQISTGGGNFPLWSQNKNELFYRTDDQRIMVSPYTVEGDSFRADRPRRWSEGQFTDRANNYNFDLHPDGLRFAVLRTPETQAEARQDKVVFIFNFFDELRRLTK